MEMQFKNEIKKLADVVVWADNWIEELKMGLTEEEFAEDEEVKNFEAVKKAVLNSMERHTVYTNALNKDIADKAAKIELLEKEIEGRKEGYWALKEKYDKLEKELEEMTKSRDTWFETAGEHSETIRRDSEEIGKLKKAFNALKEEMSNRYITVETHNDICKTYENKVADLEKELADRNVKIRHQRENLDGINKTLEIRNKEIDSLVKTLQTTRKGIENNESENARLTERIKSLKTELANERNAHLLTRDREECYKNTILEKNGKINLLKEEIEKLKKQSNYEDLKKELEEYKEKFYALKGIMDPALAVKNKDIENLKKELDRSYKAWDIDLKNHNKRETTLVDEIAKKNQKIEYYKNQERIRTDQLRATERKVEELWRLVNELKKEKKEGYDYAREGFKLYVKNTLTEAEGDKNEANEVITDAVKFAYREWDEEQKKEEETEVKGNGRTSSGRYPWGAKVDDIPCGEDAIE